VGRPSKISDKLTETICDKIRKGATQRAAFLSSGISEATAYLWMQKAKEDENPKPEYSDFLEKVKAAEAEAELHYTSMIHLHSFKDPKNAQWWLERRRNAEWDKVSKHDHTTQGEKITAVRIIYEDGDGSNS
jgi:transposase